jgi:sortase A
LKRKKLILWAVILAALFLVLGVLIWELCAPPNKEPVVIDIPNTPVPILQPTETPIATPVQAPTATPTESPKTPVPSAATPKPTGTAKPSPALFCTLTIRGSKIEVYDSVEESSLKKRPGWLSSSALPGEDGMCVVYGHRNRNHLKVLEKVERGDTITVTMIDGAVYVYTITDTKIYESTDELRLPTSDGKSLVLVTCYPFRYSGHAPGKCMVTAIYS